MKKFVPNRTTLRHQVRDVFPDAPERCLDCPALYNAASKIINSSDLAAHGLESSNDPSNPIGKPDEQNTAMGHVVGFVNRVLTDMAFEDGINTPVLAEELWAKCPMGSIEIPSLAHSSLIRRQASVGIACGSQHAIANFVAPLIVKQ